LTTRELLIIVAVSK